MASTLTTWRIVYGILGALNLLGGGGCALIFGASGDQYAGAAFAVATPFILFGALLLAPALMRQPLGPRGSAIAKALCYLYYALAPLAVIFMIYVTSIDYNPVEQLAMLPFALPGILLGDAYRRWSKDRADPS